jgi:hypothetical protein
MINTILRNIEDLFHVHNKGFCCKVMQGNLPKKERMSLASQLDLGRIYNLGNN